MTKARKDKTLNTTSLNNVGIFKDKPRRSKRDLAEVNYSEKRIFKNVKPSTLSGDSFLTKSDRFVSIKERRTHLAKIRKSIGSLAIDNMNTKDYVPSSLDQTDMVLVKPVNLLSDSGGRGLFASEDILKGTCIGVYTGEIYPSAAQFKRYLESNPDADNSYAMAVAGRIVDAATKGNFTRYINFSDSQDNAEFVEGRLNGRKVVKVVATKDIMEGQQFLINYNTYEERASKYYFFLNPNDSDLSANELYESNQQHYKLKTVHCDAPAFNLAANQQVLFTQVALAVLENKRLSAINNLALDTVDLPVFTLDVHQKVVNFDVVDVFTPLMAASYLGQVHNVRWLIENGANIDQQQNHSGNCPLFFALEGYKTAGQDKTNYLKLLKLLIQKDVNLAVHDRADRTFVHKAITVLSNEHFSDLVNTLHRQDSAPFKELFGYIEENDFDIVTFCLRNKSPDKMLSLLKKYPLYFMDNFLSSNQNLNLSNINSFKLAIKDYNSDQLNHLKNSFEESDIDISLELLVELGLEQAANASMVLDF